MKSKTSHGLLSLLLACAYPITAMEIEITEGTGKSLSKPTSTHNSPKNSRSNSPSRLVHSVSDPITIKTNSTGSLSPKKDSPSALEKRNSAENLKSSLSKEKPKALAIDAFFRRPVAVEGALADNNFYLIAKDGSLDKDAIFTLDQRENYNNNYQAEIFITEDKRLYVMATHIINTQTGNVPLKEEIFTIQFNATQEELALFYDSLVTSPTIVFAVDSNNNSYCIRKLDDMSNQKKSSSTSDDDSEPLTPKAAIITDAMDQKYNCYFTEDNKVEIDRITQNDTAELFFSQFFNNEDIQLMEIAEGQWLYLDNNTKDFYIFSNIYGKIPQNTYTSDGVLSIKPLPQITEQPNNTNTTSSESTTSDEEKRLAEKEKLAEEERLAEQAKLAEAIRLEEERLARQEAQLAKEKEDSEKIAQFESQRLAQQQADLEEKARILASKQEQSDSGVSNNNNTNDDQQQKYTQKSTTKEKRSPEVLDQNNGASITTTQSTQPKTKATPNSKPNNFYRVIGGATFVVGMGAILYHYWDKLPNLADKFPTLAEKLSAFSDKLPTISDKLPNISVPNFKEIFSNLYTRIKDFNPSNQAS